MFIHWANAEIHDQFFTKLSFFANFMHNHTYTVNDLIDAPYLIDAPLWIEFGVKRPFLLSAPYLIDAPPRWGKFIT